MQFAKLVLTTYIYMHYCSTKKFLFNFDGSYNDSNLHNAKLNSCKLLKQHIPQHGNYGNQVTPRSLLHAHRRARFFTLRNNCSCLIWD
jgi:hypothetical protein